MRLHVAVLGAGVLGVSVAGRLAALGHRVTLIEAAHPGAGTTSTTFAWINANRKEPRGYFELNVAGMAAHRRALDEPGGAPWLRLTGHLRWAEPEKQAELADNDERLRSWGYTVEHLTARDARQLEPDLRLEGVDEYSFYPDEGFVLPLVYLGRLLREAESKHVELRTESPVVGFDGAGGRLRAAVLDSSERVAADAFACCCGRWTPEVTGRAGVTVPLVPVERGSPALGLLGTTWPVPAELTRVVTSPTLNVRPDGGGRLLLQALDLERSVQSEAPPSTVSEAGAELLRRAGRILRRLEGARLESLRFGIRPLPRDGLTVAGWAPGVDGLYVLVTHSGITLAPVLGEMVAREIGCGVEEPLLAPFRPARFSS